MFDTEQTALVTNIRNRRDIRLIVTGADQPADSHALYSLTQSARLMS